MDFDQIGQIIVENVGGRDNISAFTHCATRLRFTLKKKSLVNRDVLKNTVGILGLSESSGQFQVIIGNEVPHVYESLTKLVDQSSLTEDNSEKKGIIARLFDTISGIFTPILPAIIGAGLIKSFLALAVLLGMDDKSQTYYFLNLIGDAPLYFLPVMLAYTCAKKFNTNPFIAIAIAGAMLHPNYTALLTDKFNIHFSHFLGIPVTLATYSSSVIPIILAVLFLKYVDKLCEKILPKLIKFFLKPVLCMIIVAPVTFIVLGPIGFVIGTGISTGLNVLGNYVPWLVPTLVGCIYPLLVTTGMHYGLVPFMIQSYASLGYETIAAPGNMPSNIAQGAAALCVAVKTKNLKLKQLGFSSGVTALLGITEPALFGVTLKIKRALYAVMIGGGIGGLYAGITRVKGYAFCAPGVISLPAFIGPDGWTNLINTCISMVIAFVVTFVILWFWGFEDIPETDAGAASTSNSTAARTVNSGTQSCSVTLASPLTGKILNLSEVPDEAFSTEALGKGCAILPSKGEVRSPCDGVISVLPSSFHAVGITSNEGADILVHIGINTVELKGKGFNVNVKEGQQVKKGELLVSFDLDIIKKAGYSIITPVIVSNIDQFPSIIKKREAGQSVDFGENLFIAAEK